MRGPPVETVVAPSATSAKADSASTAPRPDPNASGSSAKWHDRFLDLAHHVAQWSKDPSTKVGVVLVSPDRYIVIPGFNGFPRGIEDTEERLTDRVRKYPRVVHAEANVLLNCPRRPEGWSLYCTMFPCASCAAMVIQAGVRLVMAPAPLPGRWGWSQETAREMFLEAGLIVLEC